MKSKIFTIALMPAFAVFTMISYTANAQDMKLCIITALYEVHTLTIDDWYSPGDVKTLHGTADFTGYGCGVWTETGTIDKSTKTILTYGVNPSPDTACICANTYTDTWTNVGGRFLNLSYVNDCAPGGYPAIAVFGISNCNWRVGEFFSEKVAAGSGASGAGVANTNISRIIDLPAGENLDLLFSETPNIAVYPNPISNHAVITYMLQEESSVDITIYNSVGQLINTLEHAHQSSGIHSLNWNVTNNQNAVVGGGLYFVRISSDSGAQTIPVVIER